MVGLRRDSKKEDIWRELVRQFQIPDRNVDADGNVRSVKKYSLLSVLNVCQIFAQASTTNLINTDRVAKKETWQEITRKILHACCVRMHLFMIRVTMLKVKNAHNWRSKNKEQISFIQINVSHCLMWTWPLIVNDAKKKTTRAKSGRCTIWKEK